MTIAVGINKSVAYKKETTWGTLAGASGAKLLRRVTSNFNLTKETYQSNEIRTDYQIADYRHGVRSVEGSLSGELSPGTYADFFAAAVAKDFVAGVSVTGLSYTIAAAGDLWTVTVTGGDLLAGGLKTGDVVRITAAGGNANNTGRNLMIVALTASVATVTPLNGGAMTAEGPIASATIAVQGKKTFAPLTGHTDNSFTVEEFYADVAQSEVTTGNKVNTVSMALPSTGLVTCEFGFMGKDLAQTGTTQYFTSPAAQGTSGIFAAVNGVLVVDGEPVALLTNLNMSINRNLQNATAVGSNSVVEMFEGRIQVEGDMSVYFQDAKFRDLFKDETEASLMVALTTSNEPDADFMAFTLPRIKVNSNTRDDSESGLTSQNSFFALLNINGGTGLATEKTTIVIQDALA